MGSKCYYCGLDNTISHRNWYIKEWWNNIERTRPGNDVTSECRFSPLSFVPYAFYCCLPVTIVIKSIWYSLIIGCTPQTQNPRLTLLHKLLIIPKKRGRKLKQKSAEGDSPSVCCAVHCCGWGKDNMKEMDRKNKKTTHINGTPKMELTLTKSVVQWGGGGGWEWLMCYHNGSPWLEWLHPAKQRPAHQVLMPHEVVLRSPLRTNVETR